MTQLSLSLPLILSFSSVMAPLLLSLFILAIVEGSDGAWCVCNPAASSSDQQKAIDYACGAGANCAPILQNGACYSPTTVSSHCSYAVNSYYQKNNQDPQACNFAGVGQIATTDPSASGCSYPSTASAVGTGGTPSTSQTPPVSSIISPPPPGTPNSNFTPTTGTPNSNFTPTTGTPNSNFTPSTGTGFGGLGLGPTGTIESTDAGFLLKPQGMVSLITLSGLIFSLRI